MDLSRLRNTSIPQQVSFIEKPEDYDNATKFFITERQQKLFQTFL